MVVRLGIRFLVFEALHADLIARRAVARIFDKAKLAFLPRYLRLPGYGVGIGSAAAGGQ
jgi:hypothetical protein